MRARRTTTTRAFASPFPALELTAGDEARLEDMAYFLVQSSVAEYENYLYKDERVVDRDQWKFLKRKKKVRVYTERPEREATKRRAQSMRLASSRAEGSDLEGSFCCFDRTCSSAADTSAGSSLSSAASAAAARSGNLNWSMDNRTRQVRASLGLPAFLVAGSIEGSLDDAMYGVVSPTVDAMRVKSSYVRDNIVNAAVLATIIAPTAENPFRSLSVKWIERGPPGRHLGALVKHHDVVILESTGVTRLANGERVGYVLLHSVQFPETHELPSVVRSGLSVCMLLRAESDASVDVFLIGNVDPVRGLLRPLAVKSAVEGFISVWRFVECARMKKLAWALQQQHACSIGAISVDPEAHSTEDTQSRARNESVASAASSVPELAAVSVRCTHCRRVAPTASGRRRLWLLRRSAKRLTRCALCCEYVCSSCTVTQKVSYVAHEGESPGHRLQQQHRQQQTPSRSASRSLDNHSASQDDNDNTDTDNQGAGVLRQREIAFCALCIHVAVQRTQSLAVATEEAAALARNSVGHKSLITAWLRGMLDLPPLCRYARRDTTAAPCV